MKRHVTNPAPVLAFRQGERPRFFKECPGSGVEVFAVALVQLPELPLPREPHTSSVSVVCACRQGMDNNWGWVQMEPGSKEIVALELEQWRFQLGQWVYLKMEYSDDLNLEDTKNANP